MTKNKIKKIDYNNSLLIFEKDSPLENYFKNKIFQNNLEQNILFENKKFVILTQNKCYNF